VFHALDNTQIRAIAKIQLTRLEERLAAQDMKLEVSDAALAEIAKVGFDPLYGARPLKRAIQQEIENPVARLVLEGSLRAQGRDSGRRQERRADVRPNSALAPLTYATGCAGRTCARGGQITVSRSSFGRPGTRPRVQRHGMSRRAGRESGTPPAPAPPGGAGPRSHSLVGTAVRGGERAFGLAGGRVAAHSPPA
jgi:hypothetical protein